MSVEITSVVGSQETGARLIELIEQCQSFSWASAWVTRNRAFNEAIGRKEKLESLVIGTHMYITDPECLVQCLEIPQAKVLLPGTGPLFHPKLYAFRLGQKATIYVGSANCTDAGLTRNIEAGAFITGEYSDPSIRSFFDFIKEQAARAASIDKPLVASYRANKEAKEDALKDLDKFIWLKPPKLTATTSLQSELNSADWADFVQLVNGDQFKHMRLELLNRARQLFASGRPFREFDSTEQQCVTGLLDPTSLNGVDWGLFGQMTAHTRFPGVLREYGDQLSLALDQIPLVGPVKRRHYDAFLERLLRVPTSRPTWIGFGTRMLAIKRPDHFVCICSPNERQIADQFGTAFSTFTLDNYWDRIVAPMQLMPWWQAEMPSDKFEQQLWMGRAAMLDAICYDPAQR